MNLNVFNKKKVTKKKSLSLREKKQLSNLPRSSGLYFPVGLVSVLVVVFGLFQMKFEKRELVIDRPIIDVSSNDLNTPPNFTIEREMPIELLKNADRVHVEELTTIKVVDNDAEVLPTIIYDLPVVLERAPLVKDIKVVVEEEVVEPIPISLVSEIPVFPGCEKIAIKKKRFECLSIKIGQHVNKKFNIEMAVENGIIGKQRILVTFVINVEGRVVNVKARAPHPTLQKEAIKVIELLPNMKPAKQGFKNVPVSYALPITIKIE